MVVSDGDLDELTREVERIVFEGGGDAPEHQAPLAHKIPIRELNRISTTRFAMNTL
jgi:hypothetical protein